MIGEEVIGNRGNPVIVIVIVMLIEKRNREGLKY